MNAVEPNGTDTGDNPPYLDSEPHPMGEADDDEGAAGIASRTSGW